MIRGLLLLFVAAAVALSGASAPHRPSPAPTPASWLASKASHEPHVTGVYSYVNHPFSGQDALASARASLRRGSANNAANESSYGPIRIVQYSTGLLSNISTAKATFLTETIMPAAIDFFADTLKVFPVSGNLGVPHSCSSVHAECAQCAGITASDSELCGFVSIPSDHLGATDLYGNTQFCSSCAGGSCTSYTAGTGVTNTDMLIYVTAQTVGGCNTTDSGRLAAAASCRADQYDRPVVGYINFCPAQINETVAVNSSSYKAQLAAAIHQITHALGFSSSHYAYYRDHENAGAPYTTRFTDGEPSLGTMNLFGTTINKPSSRVLANSTERNTTVWKIKTNTTLAKARNQTGCSTLDGVELENQGGVGIAGEHWEKRVYMNDFMTGVSVSGQTTVYSDVTFGLLEDTGWYFVNWNSSKITTGTWLNGAGCTAVTSQCLTNGTNATSPVVVSGGSGFFCGDAETVGCGFDRTAKGKCNICPASGCSWSSIPSEFQYFPSSAVTGGGIELADYCPIVEASSSTVCTDASTGTVTKRSDVFGSSSKCFSSTLLPSSESSTSEDPLGCYQHCCTSTTPVTLRLTLATGQCATCTTAGEALSFPDFSGNITCPNPATVCTSTSPACSGSCSSTATPTKAPTKAPTNAPTSPTEAPTNAGGSSTGTPTNEPTKAPTSPTKAPTSPTKAPTNVGGSSTGAPTNGPTLVPSLTPSVSIANTTSTDSTAGSTSLTLYMVGGGVVVVLVLIGACIYCYYHMKRTRSCATVAPDQTAKDKLDPGAEIPIKSDDTKDDPYPPPAQDGLFPHAVLAKSGVLGTDKSLSKTDADRPWLLGTGSLRVSVQAQQILDDMQQAQHTGGAPAGDNLDDEARRILAEFERLMRERQEELRRLMLEQQRRLQQRLANKADAKGILTDVARLLRDQQEELERLMLEQQKRLQERLAARAAKGEDAGQILSDAESLMEQQEQELQALMQQQQDKVQQRFRELSASGDDDAQRILSEVERLWQEQQAELQRTMLEQQKRLQERLRERSANQHEARRIMTDAERLLQDQQEELQRLMLEQQKKLQQRLAARATSGGDENLVVSDAENLQQEQQQEVQRLMLEQQDTVRRGADARRIMSDVERLLQEQQAELQRLMLEQQKKLKQRLANKSDAKGILTDVARLLRDQQEELERLMLEQQKRLQERLAARAAKGEEARATSDAERAQQEQQEELLRLMLEQQEQRARARATEDDARRIISDTERAQLMQQRALQSSMLEQQNRVQQRLTARSAIKDDAQRILSDAERLQQQQQHDLQSSMLEQQGKVQERVRARSVNRACLTPQTQAWDDVDELVPQRVLDVSSGNNRVLAVSEQARQILNDTQHAQYNQHTLMEQQRDTALARLQARKGSPLNQTQRHANRARSTSPVRPLSRELLQNTAHAGDARRIISDVERAQQQQQQDLQSLRLEQQGKVQERVRARSANRTRPTPQIQRSAGWEEEELVPRRAAWGQESVALPQAVVASPGWDSDSARQSEADLRQQAGRRNLAHSRRHQ